MHTASYEFLMKPKESAGCHQTLSTRVGSGDETTTSYELFVFRHNMGGAGAKIINLPYMEYDVPMLEPFHP